MLSVICSIFATDAASPMPGNRNILLHCEGNRVTPSSSVTGSKGEPAAKTAFPLVHLYACSAVHSALLFGFERGKMKGCSVCFATSFTTSSVKMPPTALSPIRMVGLKWAQASTSFVSAGMSDRANTSCCLFRPLERSECSGPSLSMITNLFAASSTESPIRTMASKIMCATPIPALPAPAMRMRWSLSFSAVFPRLIIALMSPASVTAPVPWMSSLKTHTGLRKSPRSSR
mmetsp:Transcript_150/g.389  ORF Transcript_150/g.389 Transcript_150/m.389 type:complete len:231 (-) Transcript_150:310-1002(-)